MKQQHHSAPQRTAERRAYTIKRFCESFDLSRATVYRLFRAGSLSRMKVGKRTLIPSESVEAWAASALAQS